MSKGKYLNVNCFLHLWLIWTPSVTTKKKLFIKIFSYKLVGKKKTSKKNIIITRSADKLVKKYIEKFSSWLVI